MRVSAGGARPIRNVAARAVPKLHRRVISLAAVGVGCRLKLAVALVSFESAAELKF